MTCAFKFSKSIKRTGSETCAGARGSRFKRELVRDNSNICPHLVCSDKTRCWQGFCSHQGPSLGTEEQCEGRHSNCIRPRKYLLIKSITLWVVEKGCYWSFPVSIKYWTVIGADWQHNSKDQMTPQCLSGSQVLILCQLLDNLDFICSFFYHSCQLSLWFFFLRLITSQLSPKLSLKDWLELCVCVCVCVKRGHIRHIHLSNCFAASLSQNCDFSFMLYNISSSCF